MENAECREPSLPSATPLPNIGLLVDLGRQSREQITRLKQGEGPLTHQIQTAITSSREQLEIDPDAEIIPVVLLYRRAKPDYVVITLPASAPPVKGACG
jgi:hypothetical protein